MGVTANRYGASFWGDGNDVVITALIVNILKPTELYVLKQ